jgi:hypothetical protein
VSIGHSLGFQTRIEDTARSWTGFSTEKAAHVVASLSLTGGRLMSGNADTQRCAALIAARHDGGDHEAPGETIEPVLGSTHQGVLSLVDGAGRRRVHVQLLRQAIATKAPDCRLVGNRQCVREIGAPAAVRWIAGYGRVAL